MGRSRSTPIFLLLIFVGVIFEASRGLQWSPKGLSQEASVSLCEGGELSLDWALDRAAGEAVLSRQWNFRGRDQERSATWTVMPALGGRAKLQGEAGLVVSNVSRDDSGNFSVTVSGLNALGKAVTLTRSAVVDVGGDGCVAWANHALKDGTELYTCAGYNLTLDWDINAASGGNIVVIEWFFKGMSEVLLATFTHGFFNPMPQYSGRVQLRGRAGVTLANVTSYDAGNYSVMLTAADRDGMQITLQREVRVLVGEGLMTTDGGLHAAQKPVAVLDAATNDFHVELACSAFRFTQYPPFLLQWITPSGQRVSSSGYKDGEFLLRLQNPVQGGRYVCEVPAASLGLACLHGASPQAAVTVDAVNARLTLLEAHNTRLRGEAQDLRKDATDLRKENELLKAEDIRQKTVDELLQAKDKLIEAEFAKYKAVNSSIISAVKQLQDSGNKTVGFMATGLTNYNKPAARSTLVFSHVITNIGSAYNKNTGHFVVPYNGLYSFSASLTGYKAVGQDFRITVMVDGIVKATALERFELSGYWEQVSLDVILVLTAGQSVWLNTYHDGIYFWSSNSQMFGGYIVSAYP